MFALPVFLIRYLSLDKGFAFQLSLLFNWICTLSIFLKLIYFSFFRSTLTFEKYTKNHNSDAEIGILNGSNSKFEFEDLKRKLNFAVGEFSKGVEEIKKYKQSTEFKKTKRKSARFSKFLD